MWLVGPDGANPWLFRGGFLLCAVATLMMVAAVTHERAFTSRILSIPVLLWIGTRSYGLYLYHWPIYQLMRNIAGKPLTLHEFVIAMVLTGIITEASYRFIETPIRKGTFGESWPGSVAHRSPGPAMRCSSRRRRRCAHVVRHGQPGDGAGRGERGAPVARPGRRRHLRRGQRPDCDGVIPTDRRPAPTVADVDEGIPDGDRPVRSAVAAPAGAPRRRPPRLRPHRSPNWRSATR
jgi:hypothetical protein